MDTNNLRPIQCGEFGVDAGDWRSQLLPDSRHRHVDEIMETLKRKFSNSGDGGLRLSELRRKAVMLEHEIYTFSTSQSNYLRNISLKMLDMETKSHTTSMANPWSSNSTLLSNKPLDYASQSLQPQVLNQEPSMFSKPHLLFPNIQNNIASQSLSSLPSTVPPIMGLDSTTTTTMVGQNPNIQNTSWIPQNPSMDCQSNALLLEQLQQQMFYHHVQLQNRKFEYANFTHQLLQSQTPQQQHNLMLPNQPESIPQQSVMQPWLPLIQKNQHCHIQQPTQSILQQPPQPSLMLQQPSHHPVLHQQPTMSKQPSLLSQQLPQPWLHGHQSNLSNMESFPSESLMFSGYLPLSNKDLTDPGVRWFPPGSSHWHQSLQCLSRSLHQQPTMSQQLPQPWSHGHQSNLLNMESLPSESLMFSGCLPLSDKDLKDPRVRWFPPGSFHVHQSLQCLSRSLHQQPTMSQQLPQPWSHGHQSNLSNMESLPSESLMFSGYLPLSDKDLTDPGVRWFPPGSSHGHQSLQCCSDSLHQQPTMSQKLPQPWSHGHQSNLSNMESLPSESLMFSGYLPLSDKDLTDPVIQSPGSSQSQVDRSKLLSDSQYLECIFLLIFLLLLLAFLCYYNFYLNL